MTHTNFKDFMEAVKQKLQQKMAEIEAAKQKATDEKSEQNKED